MADELIDIYDVNMNHIGTAMKSQAHNEGLWHKAFHCWIVKAKQDGNHEVWLQLRGRDKDLYPNLLDISAAGHLQAGETAKDGIREIEEELGLKVDLSKLTKLFTYTLVENVGNIINREFSPTYVLETDANLEDLRMQPEEVDGVFIANLKELLDLINGNKKIITVNGVIRNDDNTNSKQTRNISINDLVPHGDEFYKKTFDALNRFCNGLIHK